MSEVVPVDEASGIFDRAGWSLCPCILAVRISHSSCPVAKSALNAPELGTIEGQLKALLTL